MPELVGGGEEKINGGVEFVCNDVVGQEVICCELKNCVPNVDEVEVLEVVVADDL